MTPARCRKVKGRSDELRTEAPVNGGRNYNGPKVKGNAGLSKIRLYAGTSEYLQVLAHSWAVTILGVRTISRKGQLERLGELESPETIRRTAVGQQLKRWSGLHGDMQERLCRSLIDQMGNRLERNSLSGEWKRARTG